MGELIAEPTEITGTALLTPEQQATIENAVKLLREVWEAVKRALNWVLEVLHPIWERFVEIYMAAKADAHKSISDLLDAMLYAANDDPKSWHIYTHTKKRRTRKKYRDKLMRQLVAKLTTAKRAEL